ncbi:MAG: cupin domain-containing protein [Firmicutes bacterium]|nr:cupin domain-containing protein [Bacillota bacterium]
MLGERIRKKRKERDKSLSELSELTGLTASFLSQVERDVTEPSITSLRKIARALDVPIFYFLLDTEEQSPVVRAENRKVLKFPQSDQTFELLTPDLSGQMELMIATLKPNTATCDEPLTHPGEECTFVLEGEMGIEIGEDNYHLKQGDSIYFYCTIPHKITNVGKTDLVFVSVMTPPSF